MGVIRYKIWYDLWENMGRTLRVVAIIAIGAFAVGTVLGAKQFILSDVTATWQLSAPATIGLDVTPAVDDEMIQTLENLREIEAVEGWAQDKTVRWRPGPNAPWQPATLVALDDYEDQTIRKILLDSGDWPHRKQMGVQRDRNLSAGDRVELDVDGKSYPVALNGVLYNTAYPSYFSSPEPMFFTTRERFAELTGETGASLVLATIPNYSDEAVQSAANRVQHELEKQNAEIEPAISGPGGFKQRTGKPDQFTGQDAINSVFMILTIMAASTLILGLFLVYNTISAIIVQQVSQIGVMKAVGAGFGRIILVYFSMVLVYAALALLVAVPLGALGAHGLRMMMVTRMGMQPGPFAISGQAVAVQSAVALLLPLLVAVVPVYAGAQVTVREAISTYGLGAASGLLDRLLVRLDFIPRVVSMTLSNTFRNKKRVLLTQITLVGAGVIFMMVMNTRTTLRYTFGDVLLSIYETNILLDLKDEARLQTIEALALSHPETTRVEVWAAGKGTVRPAGQPETNDDDAINLRGVPVPSRTYIPQLRGGRGLQPGDKYAAVLSQELAARLGAGVGDWVTIDIPATRSSEWQIVGLLFEPVDQNVALVPQDTLLRETRQVGRGKSIRVQTQHTDPASEAATAAELRAIFESRGFDVLPSTKDTSYRLATRQADQMALLFIILTGMAVMTAVVGAVALSGTLSINVMERTREIGVMRAIGASSGVIAGQFVGEGVILGWLSWLLAIPFSVPAGLLVVKTLSAVLHIELVYQVSWMGMGYWLGIITILAVIASYFPAQKAANTSVRESLAYI